MEHLQTVDEVVDFSHEALHEDDLRQADAEVPEASGERL